MSDDLEKLMEIIGKFVSQSGSWKSKRAFILNNISADERTNLEEFAAWFEETDIDNE